MAQDPNNLIWIDMEMSGLNPETDRILEIALVVTDSRLDTVAEAPVMVVRQPDPELPGMAAQEGVELAGGGGAVELGLPPPEEAHVGALQQEDLLHRITRPRAR